MLPQLLYRGDSDRNGTRRLKECLGQGILFTNLIDGGNGQVIFERPLFELISNHVSPGFNKTHFLSFSEDEETALRFGSFEVTGEIQPYFEEDGNWDFILIKFKTSGLSDIKMVEVGVYECEYSSSQLEFHNRFKLLIFDTVTYLKKNFSSTHQKQLENASKNKEWLIFPANQYLFNNNKVEFKSKIDISNVFDFEKYIMI
jgi:hypothetical protein